MKPYCFSQRLNSMFFEKKFNGVAPKRPERNEEEISSNVDFSLWVNMQPHVHTIFIAQLFHL